MSKFKVGDRVIIQKDSGCYSDGFSGIQAEGKGLIHGYTPKIPQKGEVINTNVGKCLVKYYVGGRMMQLSFSIEDLTKDGEEILTNKIKTIKMNLITTFKNITRTEPNKTFVKAGVMNEDLSLTSEGTQLFIQFMFNKHATEFKKEVVDLIVEENAKDTK